MSSSQLNGEKLSIETEVPGFCRRQLLLKEVMEEGLLSVSC